MISVLSLPQPLNGSRTIWIKLLPVVFLIFSSCELFKKAQTTPDTPDDENMDIIEGRRVYDPDLGQWVVIQDLPTEKIDTIKWVDIPKEQSPPITSITIEPGDEGSRLLKEGAMGSKFFSRYNVSLLLPFLAKDYSSITGNINPNSFWALHYYCGVQMALEALKNEQISLELSVFDSQGDVGAVGRMLGSQNQLKESHLIIGPYRRDNVKQVAEFAKQNDITFVSPYSGTSNLSTDNPNYIQVSPTLQTHCRSLVNRAKKRFRTQQIVLVCQDNPAERSWLKYCQEEHFLMEGSDRVPPLKQYIIPATSADFPALQFDSLFASNDSVAIIVPSWSEPFVYNLLRKADLAKSFELYLEIYGLPQWMFFEQMDYNYYEKLNVFVTSNFFLDPNDRTIRTFKERYINKFGITPRTESYLGYDVTLFFGRMLHKHGTKFQYSLEQEKVSMLHTRFEFFPQVEGQSEYYSPQIDQFENKYVHILEFKDFLFQPVKP